MNATDYAILGAVLGTIMVTLWPYIQKYIEDGRKFEWAYLGTMVAAAVGAALAVMGDLGGLIASIDPTTSAGSAITAGLAYGGATNVFFNAVWKWLTREDRRLAKLERAALLAARQRKEVEIKEAPPQ